LGQRLTTILVNFAKDPGGSIPQASKTWKGTKATYRFFDNERVTVDEIASAERKATVRRLGGAEWVLAVQDTTALSFTGLKETEGLGPIGGPGDKARGLFMHSVLAVRPDGVPEGLLDMDLWARGQKGDIKESDRWSRGVRSAREAFPKKTRVVVIGDRESDIFGVFEEAHRLGSDLLVRVHHDRQVLLDDTLMHLTDAAFWGPELGQVRVQIPRRAGSPEHPTTMTLHASRILVTAPRGYPQSTDPIPLTALWAYEETPQKDQDPIEWFLLTTLPAENLEDGAQLLRFYSYRWRIERFHFALKSGCGVEKLELEMETRLEKAIAVYAMVASRLVHLLYQSRATPDAPASVAFSDAEWKALYVATHKSADVPGLPPSLSTAVIWVARLGGFLARRGDGDPGVKSLWRGLRKLEIATSMWQIMSKQRSG